MSAPVVHWRVVWSMVLILVTIAASARLAQVDDIRPPASVESVVAALNREIASVVIADDIYTISIALHGKDRFGGAEVIVSISWPSKARSHVGEALGVFSRRGDALCRQYGRRFDPAPASESLHVDPKTQRTMVNLRYWISSPAVKGSRAPTPRH